MGGPSKIYSTIDNHLTSHRNRPLSNGSMDNTSLSQRIVKHFRRRVTHQADVQLLLLKELHIFFVTLLLELIDGHKAQRR